MTGAIRGREVTMAIMDELEELDEAVDMSKAFERLLHTTPMQHFVSNAYNGAKSDDWLAAVRYGELSFAALEEQKKQMREANRQAARAAEERRAEREAKEEADYLRTLPTFGMF